MVPPPGAVVRVLVALPAYTGVLEAPRRLADEARAHPPFTDAVGQKYTWTCSARTEHWPHAEAVPLPVRVPLLELPPAEPVIEAGGVIVGTVPKGAVPEG